MTLLVSFHLEKKNKKNKGTKIHGNHYLKRYLKLTFSGIFYLNTILFPR